MVFEENPRNITLKELVFFAYKYYVKNYKTGVKSDFQTVENQQIVLCQGQPSLTIAIGGDLMPYKMITPKNCKNMWKEAQFFFEADIVLANLETPIDLTKKESFVPELMINNMNFNSSEEQFNVFENFGHSKGYDVLTFANNHTLDMGYEGIKNTLNFLNGKNIAVCGVGEQNTHIILTKEGIKVGFAAFTFSLNQYQADTNHPIKINVLPLNKPQSKVSKTIIAEIDTLKNSGADFVILSLHTGNAYQPFPGPQTIELFKTIAQNCDVDAIIGGHPHNIQPLEIINKSNKKVFMAYSLGDFIAYDIYNRCHLTLCLQLNIGWVNKTITLLSINVRCMLMEYKQGLLNLKDFDKMMCENSFVENKMLQDLKWLYLTTLKNKHNFE